MRTKKKNLRTHADGLAGRIAPHVETAREKAGPVIADARDKAGPVLAEARERTKPLIAEAREKAAPVLEKAGPVLEKAGPRLAEAREKAGPILADARDKAGPMLADAREKAAPAVAEARERFATEVVPVVTAALAAANEATEDVREEGLKRGRAAVAALRGEVEPPKKKHRVRTGLLVVGLGGAVALVAKKLSDRQASTAWQSAYTPPAPAPAAEPTTAAGTPGAHRAPESADDEAGASPDVAVADSAAEPHTPTTPDNPAEEVDLKKQ